MVPGISHRVSLSSPSPGEGAWCPRAGLTSLPAMRLGPYSDVTKHILLLTGAGTDSCCCNLGARAAKRGRTHSHAVWGAPSPLYHQASQGPGPAPCWVLSDCRCFWSILKTSLVSHPAPLSVPAVLVQCQQQPRRAARGSQAWQGFAGLGAHKEKAGAQFTREHN